MSWGGGEEGNLDSLEEADGEDRDGCGVLHT